MPQAVRTIRRFNHGRDIPGGDHIKLRLCFQSESTCDIVSQGVPNRGNFFGVLNDHLGLWCPAGQSLRSQHDAFIINASGQFDSGHRPYR